MHTCISVCTQTYISIHAHQYTNSTNEAAYVRRPCKDVRKVYGSLLQRQKRQDGSEQGCGCSLTVAACLCFSPPYPTAHKFHTITCQVQSVPLYKHTVYKIGRKMYCTKQEKLLREILLLQLCESSLAIITVSSVLQISELDCWVTEVTVPGFGAVRGDHSINFCSLRKMWGYKSRILKYRCTWPGNIVERKKVHLVSFILGETEVLPSAPKPIVLFTKSVDL